MGGSVSVNNKTHQKTRIIYYRLLDDNDKAYIVNNFKEFYTNTDVTKLNVYDDHDSLYYIIINTFKICFKYHDKTMLIDFILTLNRPFVFDEDTYYNYYYNYYNKAFTIKFIYYNNK
jgi:hypothetical protein